MALTPLRWIAIAVAGCLMMSLIVLEIADGPDGRIYNYRRSTDSSEQRLEARANLAWSRTWMLASRYRLLKILDSTQRVTSSGAAAPVVRVFADDAFAPAVRALIDSSVRRAVAGKPGPQAKIGVDVAFAFDTARFERGVLRDAPYGIDARYVIPARTGDRCRVVARMGMNPSLEEVSRTLRQQATADQLLGPCAYYAAFGEPGRHVRDWLIAEGWRYSVDGSWTDSTPVGTAGYFNELFFEGPSYVLYWLPARSPGVRCLRGDDGACTGAVFEAVRSRGRARAVGDATVGIRLGNRQYVETGLGSRGSTLLADAVRLMGRERFQAFWTSPDSLPVAFEKASGREWDGWIRTWLEQKYGTLRAGPRVSSNALGTSVLLIILSLAVVLWFALNRRYV